MDVAERAAYLTAGNPPFPVFEADSSSFADHSHVEAELEPEPESPWTPFAPSTTADPDPQRCTNELLVHLDPCGAFDWQVLWALERTSDGQIGWVEPWTGEEREIAPLEAVWDYWQACGPRSTSHRQAMLAVRPGASAAAVAYIVELLDGEHNPHLPYRPDPPLLPGEAPFSDDDPTDAVDESLPFIPPPLRPALVWQVAAQLTRRHPNDIWVVYDPGPDGSLREFVALVDSRTFGRRWHVLLNQGGTGMLITPTGDGWRWPRFWEGHDGRDFLVQIEQRLGLARPTRPLPPSTPASLTVRWIAQFLALQIGSRHRWHAVGGIVADNDHQFLGLPDIRRPTAGPNETNNYWTVGYGTPFAESWRPRAVLSIHGELWIPNSQVQHLAKLHRSGAPISGLVVRTAGDLLP